MRKAKIQKHSPTHCPFLPNKDWGLLSHNLTSFFYFPTLRIHFGFFIFFGSLDLTKIKKESIESKKKSVYLSL